MSREPIRSLIGMGGNIGDVFDAMQIGIGMIAANPDCQIAAISPVYRTAPWGLLDQPDFFNCCVAVDTALDPLRFLDLLQSIEASGGRQRDIRWGPRTLDIDILTFGDEPLSSERLEVPHPRMLERAFVMVPLADIAPETRVAGERVKDIAARLDRAGVFETSRRLEMPDEAT